MKKKNLKHNGLKLNKNVVSNLETNSVKGGMTLVSCFADADTNCGFPTNNNCGSILGCPVTGNCPPTDLCIPSISCEPVGIC